MGVLPHKGLPSLIMADNPSEVQAPPVTSTETAMICTSGAPQMKLRRDRTALTDNIQPSVGKGRNGPGKGGRGNEMSDD